MRTKIFCRYIHQHASQKNSPVPFLIRRAVALGSLPFPQMMKALLREEFQQALVELNRELGIKEESS